MAKLTFEKKKMPFFITSFGEDLDNIESEFLVTLFNVSVVFYNFSFL